MSGSSSSSRRRPPLVPVKKEMFTWEGEAPVKKKAPQMEMQKLPNVKNPQTDELSEDEDVPYLSGKPFFDVVLAKSHVCRPYSLHLPMKIVPELPCATVPVVLRHGRKKWNCSYVGKCTAPRFDPKWKDFVIDNKLEEGDVCVFELMECSRKRIEFKVHILRDDLPDELKEKVGSCGTSVINPIDLD